MLAALDTADLPAREMDRARQMARSRTTPSAAELITRAARALAHPSESRRDDEAALELARAAVELAPDSPNFLDTLARLLARCGRGEEARRASARAVELAEASAVKMFGFTSKPPDQATADRLGVDAGTLLVATVTAGSTAEHADLRPGDIVTAVDGGPATTASLGEAKASHGFFAAVPLDVRRDAASIRIEVRVGAQPKSGYLTLTSGGVTTTLPHAGGRPHPSQVGYTRTGLAFVNRREEVDFNGDRQPYFRLGPKDSVMPGTFPGHVWVVAAGDLVLGSVAVPGNTRQIARVDIR